MHRECRVECRYTLRYTLRSVLVRSIYTEEKCSVFFLCCHSVSSSRVCVCVYVCLLFVHRFCRRQYSTFWLSVCVCVKDWKKEILKFSSKILFYFKFVLKNEYVHPPKKSTITVYLVSTLNYKSVWICTNISIMHKTNIVHLHRSRIQLDFIHIVSESSSTETEDLQSSWKVEEMCRRVVFLIFSHIPHLQAWHCSRRQSRKRMCFIRQWCVL